MNKYQAFDILNNLFIRINLYGVSELSQYESNEIYDALNIFKELIDKDIYYTHLSDKATPKKPYLNYPNKKAVLILNPYRCPICKLDVDYDFCQHCGQAIDWSEDEI